MNVKGHALAVAVLTELQRRVGEMLTEHRGRAGSLLDKGDGVTARSPLDGAKLGKLSMSDPKPRAVVVDEQALDGWIREHYPELCETERSIVPGAESEALDVLCEHAPHLVSWRVRAHREAVLKASVEAGVPCGPGGETEVPGVVVEPQPGRLSFRPVPELGVHAERLVAAGVVDLVEGVVRELPAGGDLA